MPTLFLKKVFIYLRIFGLMLMLWPMAFGIGHVGWSTYPTDTWPCFCFHEYCLFVVIISCILDVTLILLFLGSHWWLSTIHIGNSLYWWSNLGDSSSSAWIWASQLFGCAVRFNPWYVDIISGLGSCENQPLSSWLIVELFPLLWMKNCKWSHWNSFVCGLQYSTGLLCYVSWPSLQLW